MNAPAFDLDAQLAHDTLPVGELALSRLRLMNDARFPWFILVPRRVGMRDLIDLEASDQHVLTDEIRLVCEAMRALYKPDKLNVAALGNVTPQLHVHAIARFHIDVAWPRPVFGVGTVEAYEPAYAREVTTRMRDALGITPAP